MVKKAVLKSRNQLHGAERWIRCFPERVFLDCYGQKPFPIKLHGRSGLRFHKIAVATGAKEACRKFFVAEAEVLGLQQGRIQSLHPKMPARSHSRRLR